MRYAIGIGFLVGVRDERINGGLGFGPFWPGDAGVVGGVVYPGINGALGRVGDIGFWNIGFWNIGFSDRRFRDIAFFECGFGEFGCLRQGDVGVATKEGQEYAEFQGVVFLHPIHIVFELSNCVPKIGDGHRIDIVVDGFVFVFVLKLMQILSHYFLQKTFFLLIFAPHWRDGRAVECGGLENR